MTLSSGETTKTKKNLKFLIRFFVFRHIFPSCFLTNETSEKLATAFGSDQKHFCWRHFLFDFFVSPSAFSSLQAIWFKQMEKRNYKNKQKMYTKFKKISCSLKTILRRAGKMANIKKRKFENMIRRSDWHFNLLFSVALMPMECYQ